MFRVLLTICTGNICRSPMAECLIRAQLEKLNIKVQSAGIRALQGSPVDPLAATLIQERGLDISDHRARQLKPALLANAEIILVMEKWQQQALQNNFPWCRGKVYTLGYWEEFEIPDPYRSSRKVFENVLERIDRGIHNWLPKLS